MLSPRQHTQSCNPPSRHPRTKHPLCSPPVQRDQRASAQLLHAASIQQQQRHRHAHAPSATTPVCASVVLFCSVPSMATSVPPRRRRLLCHAATHWNSSGQQTTAGCRCDTQTADHGRQTDRLQAERQTAGQLAGRLAAAMLVAGPGRTLPATHYEQVPGSPAAEQRRTRTSAAALSRQAVV